MYGVRQSPPNICRQNQSALVDDISYSMNCMHQCCRRNSNKRVLRARTSDVKGYCTASYAAPPSRRTQKRCIAKTSKRKPVAHADVSAAAKENTTKCSRPDHLKCPDQDDTLQPSSFLPDDFDVYYDSSGRIIDEALLVNKMVEAISQAIEPYLPSKTSRTGNTND